MLSTPLIKIFREFSERSGALAGETKKNECNITLGEVHLEIRYTPRVRKALERPRNRRGISVAIYKKERAMFTELTWWEKIHAFILMRYLHRLSRRNTRAAQLESLPMLADVGERKAQKYEKNG